MTTIEDDGKIACVICGGLSHIIQSHLSKDHTTISIAEYQADYPTAPIFSDKAKIAISNKKKLQAEAVTAPVTSVDNSETENWWF